MLVGDYTMKQPLQYSQRFGKMCNCDCLDFANRNGYFPQEKRVSGQWECYVNIFTITKKVALPVRSQDFNWPTFPNSDKLNKIGQQGSLVVHMSGFRPYSCHMDKDVLKKRKRIMWTVTQVSLSLQEVF
jgi:hypothetical protein